MGGREGPLWKRLSYRLTSSSSGHLTVTDREGAQETWSGSLWDFLNDEIRTHRAAASPELPFNFCGG